MEDNQDKSICSLKIINESSCNIEGLDSLASLIERYLGDILPPSLNAFVLTDSDIKNYKQTVNKYSNEEKTNITNDDEYIGAAIVLSSLKEGTFSQVIVMWSMLFFKAIHTFFKIQITSPEIDIQPDPFSTTAFLHEIGHSIDYHTRFKNYGVMTDSSVQYNLCNFKERQGFIDEEAMALWSEFYAQYISEIVFPSLDDINLDEFFRLMNKNYDCTYNIKQKIEYCFRIGYYFSLLVARFAAKNDEPIILPDIDNMIFTNNKEFFSRWANHYVTLLDTLHEWKYPLIKEQSGAFFSEFISLFPYEI